MGQSTPPVMHYMVYIVLCGISAFVEHVLIL